MSLDANDFDRRLGFVCALGVVVLDVAYVGTGVVWLFTGGLESADPLAPAEPFLSLLEILLFSSVPLLVGVTLAIHAQAPAARRTSALVAVVFMAMFATLTTAVHFSRLVVVRDPVATAIDHDVLRLYPWPSIALAVDLLAWDLFLGLALLFLAPAIPRGQWAAAARNAAWLGGGLCVIGFLGPLSGDLRIQYLAIAGYAFVLPVMCAFLALRHAARRPPR